MHTLGTQGWFLSTMAIIFAAGWLNWKDLAIRGWRAQWLIDLLGEKPARILYLLFMSAVGSFLILDLFRAW